MSTANDIMSGSEAQLRHALFEYQAILDNASLGITFTRDRKFLHCNDRFAEMYGWPADALKGQETHIVYPSADAYAELTRLAAPILGAGQRLDVEVICVRRDGTPFWVRMLANAIDKNDHSKGTIFITEDISERKLMDEANRQLLLEYRSILDNASLGITFTRKRVFMRCSERFGQMYGWDPRELVGKSTSLVYASQESFEAVTVLIRETLADGRRLDIEVEMRRRDGSLFWCRMMAKSIDQDDPSKGSIFITEDITERKLAQENILRAKQDLELRVRERTAELATANARLEQEIRERRQIEDQVRHLANHDALTDLPNRRLLEDRLSRAMTAAKRNMDQVAVLFIDLDHFKPINDTLGHRIGDLLLQAVARRLRQVLREVDTVSRVGGDEFVLVLPDLHAREAAVEIAQRVLEGMLQPYAIETHILSVTPSMGISLYPDHSSDADELIGCADAAMYYAKKMGRKNFQFYDRILEMQERVGS
jgi:diguanylate cyclase (GGDEF)-like protein/PAS domain S-box-containing protein